MVIYMNNREIMEKVNEELKLDNESLMKFSKIVNEVPIVGKKNKNKMINLFINELNVNESVAEEYYNVFSKIIKGAIKDKLKHPFKKYHN